MQQAAAGPTTVRTRRRQMVRVSIVTVGVAGTRQLYDGDQVFLRFWDDDRPWAQVALDELSSARGEPVPGSADPRAQLELVARADEAVFSGVVEVGTGVLSLDGVELARITAVADVSATLEDLRAELEMLDAAGEEPDPDGLPGQVPIGAVLEEVRAHDGRLPIEVWVDADRRIWRVAYDLDDWVGGSVGPDGAAGAGRFALDLRDFGSRVRIEPPAPDETVNLEDLPDAPFG